MSSHDSSSCDHHRRGRRSRLTMIFVAMLFVVLALCIALPSVFLGRGSAHYDHAAIIIDSNIDFTSENGVRMGTGSPSDPFVIENWVINSPESTGIRISNTTSHFVIRGTRIQECSTGIWFSSCQNGRVTENEIEGNSAGIICSNCHDITISENDFSTNDDGALLMRYCTRISFYHNNIYDSLMLAIDWTNDVVRLDDGYPNGGNFWDVYSGVDVKSGPNQDLDGSDGIGDTYFIGSRSWFFADLYPLMSPYVEDDSLNIWILASAAVLVPAIIVVLIFLTLHRLKKNTAG